MLGSLIAVLLVIAIVAVVAASCGRPSPRAYCGRHCADLYPRGSEDYKICMRACVQTQSQPRTTSSVGP